MWKSERMLLDILPNKNRYRSSIVQQHVEYGPGSGLYKSDFFTSGNNDTSLLTSNNTAGIHFDFDPWFYRASSYQNLKLCHVKPPSDTERKCDIKQTTIIPQGDCDTSGKKKLTDYQQITVDRIVAGLKKEQNLGFEFVDITTGAGKTMIMAYLVGKLCLSEVTSDVVAKVITVSKDAGDESTFREWQADIFDLPGGTNYWQGDPAQFFNKYKTINDVQVGAMKLGAIGEGTHLYGTGSGDKASSIGDSTFYEKVSGQPPQPVQGQQAWELTAEVSDTPYRKLTERIVDKYLNKISSNKHIKKLADRRGVAPCLIVIDEPQKLFESSWTSRTKFVKFLTDLIDMVSQNNCFKLRIVFMSATINLNLSGQSEGVELENQKSLENILAHANGLAGINMYVRILSMKMFPPSYRPCVLFKYGGFPSMQGPALKDDLNAFFKKFMVPYMSFDSHFAGLTGRPLCRGSEHGLVSLVGVRISAVIEFFEEIAKQQGMMQRHVETHFHILNFDVKFKQLVEFWKTKEYDKFKRLLVEWQDDMAQKQSNQYGAAIIGFYNPKDSMMAEVLKNVFGTGDSTNGDAVRDITYVRKESGIGFMHPIDWLVVDKECVGLDIHNAKRMIYYGTPTDIQTEAVQLIARVIRYCGSGETNIWECNHIPNRFYSCTTGRLVDDSGIEPPPRDTSVQGVYEPIEIVFVDCNRIFESIPRDPIRIYTDVRHCSAWHHKSDKLFDMTSQMKETDLKKYVKGLGPNVELLEENVSKECGAGTMSIPTPDSVFKSALTGDEREKFRRFKPGEMLEYHVDTGCVRRKEQVIVGSGDDVQVDWHNIQQYDATQSLDSVHWFRDVYYKNTPVTKKNSVIQFIIPTDADFLSVFTIECTQQGGSKAALCFTNFNETFDLGQAFQKQIKLHDTLVKNIYGITKKRLMSLDGTLEENMRILVSNNGKGDRFTSLASLRTTFGFQTKAFTQPAHFVANLLRTVPICTEEAIEFYKHLGTTGPNDNRLNLYARFARYLMCESVKNEGLWIEPIGIQYIVDRMVNEPGFFEDALNGFSIDNYSLYEEEALTQRRKIGRYLWGSESDDILKEKHYCSVYVTESTTQRIQKTFVLVKHPNAQEQMPCEIVQKNSMYRQYDKRYLLLCAHMMPKVTFKFNTEDTAHTKEKHHYIKAARMDNNFVFVKSDSYNDTVPIQREENIQFTKIYEDLFGERFRTESNLYQDAASTLCKLVPEFVNSFHDILCKYPDTTVYLRYVCENTYTICKAYPNKETLGTVLALLTNYYLTQVTDQRIFEKVKLDGADVVSVVGMIVTLKDSMLKNIRVIHQEMESEDYTEGFKFVYELLQKYSDVLVGQFLGFCVNRNNGNKMWYVEMGQFILDYSMQVSTPQPSTFVKHVKEIVANFKQIEEEDKVEYTIRKVEGELPNDKTIITLPGLPISSKGDFIVFSSIVEGYDYMEVNIHGETRNYSLTATTNPGIYSILPKDASAMAIDPEVSPEDSPTPTTGTEKNINTELYKICKRSTGRRRAMLLHRHAGTGEHGIERFELDDANCLISGNSAFFMHIDKSGGGSQDVPISDVGSEEHHVEAAESGGGSQGDPMDMDSDNKKRKRDS